VNDDGIRSSVAADRKRELLGRILRERRASGTERRRDPAEPQLHATPRDGTPLPLSFAQERIWFLHQLDPSSAAYNLPVGVRLTGPLNPQLLERSFHRIIARHEVLRTTFQSIAGRPAQQVLADAPFALDRIDLSAMDRGAAQAEVERLGREHAARPFALTAAPLIRALLIDLSPDDHVLFATMHHIVSDAWSMITVILELVAMYRSGLEGRAPALPELPIQYADYARWQRAYLQRDRLAHEVAFWKSHLAGAAGVLDLPTDRPRPPLPVNRGVRHPFVVSRELTAAAREISRRENASLFMFLFAVYAVLLQRYTGHDDLVVGAAVTNRTRPETRPLIGMFINTLPLRVDLSGDPTVAELLARVRSLTAAALAHQEVPFEKLVDELKPPRCLNRTPLFQTMFVFPQGPVRSFSVSGRTGEIVDVFTGAAKFDLCLIAAEYHDSLHMYFDYKADLFEARTIGRMADRFLRLLKAAAEDGGARTSRLSMMTSDERSHARSFAAERAVPRRATTVVQAFEQQARLVPQAPAILFGTQAISYAALDRAARQLARVLRAAGVTRGARVAIFMDRGVETVIAVLGVLKARAAYVPIDPGYPSARVSFLLTDSGASAIVTTDRWRSRLSDCRTEVITVSSDVDEADVDDGEIEAGDPDDLAYVIYTSGSTGTPKGAMATHRGLANYVDWVNRCFIGDRVRHIPMVTRLSFDASVKQMYPPLLRGDPVWIVPEDVVARPDALVAALRGRSQVALNCVPSLWRRVLDAVESGHVAWPSDRVTTLMLGGEALADDLAARTFRAIPDLDIVNVYGPTETTANATTARIVPGERITIGRPIDNVTVYILDRHREPVPIGVPGILHIGGAGVGPGYLNRPDLTAEQFVDDPFDPAPGARLFDTGDVARFLEDGRIELLGRADRQVKIRGYRIELAEIERTLESHANVAAAAVVVREDAGERRLVAYVSHKAAPAPAASELREFLRNRLPEYLVPAAFVAIETMPLTPGGKVDLSSLPAATGVRPLDSPFVEPQSEMERRIADVWREVLQIDRIGIDDNFFDLGGHSMLAVEVQNRLGITLSRDVSLVDIFQSPTIRVLAHHLETPAEGSEEDAWEAQHAAAVAHGAERLSRLRHASREP
jgi:amino acid adenylation domain-containing protein